MSNTNVDKYVISLYDYTGEALVPWAEAGYSCIAYDIQRAGGLKSQLFGGEGLFLATLQGQGRVWLQSLPFSRLADRILANAPAAGGKRTGEGSLIGGLTNLLEQ